jgi:uncharacterized BrkB/YihY/UPF0761 family membrane protein
MGSELQKFRSSRLDISQHGERGYNKLELVNEKIEAILNSKIDDMLSAVNIIVFAAWTISEVMGLAQKGLRSVYWRGCIRS